MAHDTDMARTGIDMARTGIVGLDDVLGGGLSRGNIFLLEGEPGSGKTTIALQFLLTAAAAGEPSLYVTLSETEDELRDGAASHHWNLGAEIPRGWSSTVSRKSACSRKVRCATAGKFSPSSIFSPN
jgi:KaiC/GvpD/RAD55 family RecA-like ATPase